MFSCFSFGELFSAILVVDKWHLTSTFHNVISLSWNHTIFSHFRKCILYFNLYWQRNFSTRKDKAYLKFWNFSHSLSVIPLLLIYVTILYFCAGKILINWELPRGWVSYLILIYSVVRNFSLAFGSSTERRIC